ncbi:MAG TPA: DUF402 domain-containing protein [Thermomicrobiaceae bacterium]|nr:DUF402 domain-containing protein [Thermomicrobiaceae bacterium]
MPLRVVRDDDDLIALYICPGNRGKMRKGERGGPRGRDMLPGGWAGDHEDVTWHTNRALFLCRPGDAYSVGLFRRDSDGKFLYWYINLQAPLRRTRLGFDTLDHVLDVVVAPDLSSWTWKDEDEFTWYQEVGLLTPEEAIAIRAEGERAIEVMNRRESPYCDGWEHWRPDPNLTPITELPAGWDKVE